MSELEHSSRHFYLPGTFCWADLGIPDQEAAKRFYGALFGWSVHDFPMGDGSDYSMLRQGSADVAALYQQPRGEAPPSWLAYVSVQSADDAARRAVLLGGEALMDPFDVFTFGRMAVVRDPAGAVIALWEGRDHPGAGLFDQPGSLCWFELISRDPARALAFYTALFGWQSEEADGTPYTVFLHDGQPVAAMARAPAADRTPSHWLPCFAVEDCDAATEQAWEVGGTILGPPCDVADVGRLALVRDPQGASFCLLARAHQPA